MSETIFAQMSGGISVELIFLLSDYVTVAIALVIAYIAYQGYSRNDSRPMLFIAAGFVLTFGGPGLIFIVSQIISIPPLVVGGATQFVEIFGMGTILYGFIVPAMK